MPVHLVSPIAAVPRPLPMTTPTNPTPANSDTKPNPTPTSTPPTPKPAPHIFQPERRLSAEQSVMMIAKCPQHPAPESADAPPHPAPAPADIECPDDIADLFADNPAGALTWDEMLDGLEALRKYHKARVVHTK